MTHTPVLLREVVEFLVTDPGGIYVDATFGCGGHTRAILQRLDSGAQLLAIDRDPQAVARAQQEFGADPRVSIEYACFDDLSSLLASRGMSRRLSGLLFDLGVSSPQLDDPARGFSFLRDGPLDMRMDTQRGTSAAQWIQRARVAEIERVLREYGEERYARRIAAAIIAARAREPIRTTARLAAVVASANPAWEKGKHPATRSFQAIRIFVNAELQVLDSALRQGVEELHAGGRLVVISFHSLEDRIVKRFMRDRSRAASAPHERSGDLRRIGRTYRPSRAECAANPRARSAVMRVAERAACTAGAAHG